MNFFLFVAVVWAWLATVLVMIVRREAAQQKTALAALTKAAPKLSRGELQDALVTITKGMADHPYFSAADIERALEQTDGARP